MGIDLLDDATRAARTGGPTALDRFLAARTPGEALRLWLGDDEPGSPPPDRATVTRRLNAGIARIDRLLDAQVNAIIHHPDFQRLEASWRGLAYLVARLPDEGRSDRDATVKIKVLNLSWRDLVRDQDAALEFDQSQLFRKVYEDEFGTPGGEPYGVLLGDYEVRIQPGPGHPFDDVSVLGGIGSVAAAAFAPFVTGIHPSFFGLDDFADLERPIDLARVFEQAEYLKWRALRKSEDSRFVGLTLPRVLMRAPYDDNAPSGDGFQFREDVGAPDRSDHLWGNAVYAFGGVLIRAFLFSGWFAEIRGVRRLDDTRNGATCLDEGGLITGLPAPGFGTDRPGLVRKSSTDVIVTDAREKELGDLGFIAVCQCHDTEFSAIYGCPSIQEPKRYDDPRATANARLSAMLQYILCVSRFSHYLKVIGRDKVGSTLTPEECQEILQKWVSQYVTASESSGYEARAKYPLREARVEVRELPHQPGSFGCIFHLRPHHQLDQMSTALRFKTELTASRNG